MDEWGMMGEIWPGEENRVISCLVAALSPSPHPTILRTKLLLLHSEKENRKIKSVELLVLINFNIIFVGSAEERTV